MKTLMKLMQSTAISRGRDGDWCVTVLGLFLICVAVSVACVKAPQLALPVGAAGGFWKILVSKAARLSQ